MPDASAYRLLDTGDGRKLERFGDITTDRPCPSAVHAPALSPETWAEADLRFEKGEGASGWHGADALPADWSIPLDGITMTLRPAAGGQVGVFPDHRPVGRWIETACRAEARPLQVLNLFAYTGLATLCAARASTTEHPVEIVHLDGSKPAVSWARNNAQRSGLADKPVRWIVEDALRFVEREIRRQRRYDGVILDPPAFGRGPKGKTWKLSRDLDALLDGVGAILSDTPAFIALTCHDPDLTGDALGKHLARIPGLSTGKIETLPLAVPAEAGPALNGGWWARWR